MPRTKDKFSEFIADPKRYRLFCTEALQLDAQELIAENRGGVRLVDLAGITGKSESSLANIMRGSRNLTLKTLAPVMFALGYQVKLTVVPLDKPADTRKDKSVYRKCSACIHPVIDHGPGGCAKCACTSEVDV